MGLEMAWEIAIGTVGQYGSSGNGKQPDHPRHRSNALDPVHNIHLS